MAITRIQHQTFGGSGTGPFNIVLSSSPQSGNHLVLLASHFQVGFSIAQTGVTWLSKGALTNPGGTPPGDWTTIEIWVGVVGPGASSTIAITPSGYDQPGIVVAEYDGLQSGDPFISGWSAQSSDFPITLINTGSPFAVATDPTLFIAGFSVDDGLNSSFGAPTNGFTTVDQAVGTGSSGSDDRHAVLMAEKIETVPASNSSTSTLTGTFNTQFGAIFAFRGAVPGESPRVINVSPKQGEIAKVTGSHRFSLRDSDSEVDRGKIQAFLGTGKVFYEGEVLPEDRDSGPDMVFEALSGSPGVPATRSIVNDYLRIDKDQAVNMEAVYRMGGLEAPADPDASMMFEFTLRADQADMTPAGTLTGVQVGLYINDSGVVVKFLDNAGARSIHLYDAGLTGSSQVSNGFDWDIAAGKNSDGSNTFKLLWSPLLNSVKLYVKNPTLDFDELVAETTVSVFSTVPPQEVRVSQPWLIFGHGADPTATSISDWRGIFLHNVVTQPVRDGIVAGEHAVVIKTNNQTDYDGESLPQDAESSWNPLPDTFGTLGGVSRLDDTGLVLQRTDPSESLGFYRTELKILEPIVFDIWLSGESTWQDPLVDSTGMEFYVDDTLKSIRVALLQDAGGSQLVGILTGPSPAMWTSYTSVAQSFGVERHYRLIYFPGVSAKLINVVESEEGLTEQTVLEVPYAGLPASSMPGPGVGFLHNATSGGALAIMTVRRVRYTIGGEIIDWTDLASPTPTWAKVGSGTVEAGTDSTEENTGSAASIVEATGTVVVTGLADMSLESVGNYLRVFGGDNPGVYEIVAFVGASSVEIDNPAASGADSGNPGIPWEVLVDPAFVALADTDTASDVAFRKTFVGVLQSDSGWTLEARCRVASHTHEGSAYAASAEDPIRASTGVAFRVVDGTYRYVLVFAEAGPPYGKIVFLLTEESEEEGLFQIRAGNAEGTFVSVDWSEFHLYRLEKTVGGKLRLHIDEVLAFEFDTLAFEFPVQVGGGDPRVQIGHAESGILSISHWDTIKFTLSNGFDVSVQRALTDEELLQQFNQGVNIIVEAEDV